MKISFLGQGLELNSFNSVGNKLMLLFADIRFHKFTVVSAFASEAGVSGIANLLSDSKAQFTDVNIIVGVDQEGTSQEALEKINSLQVNSYIFYQREAPIFHPKIYVFEGDEDKVVIVGSSNLTAKGLFGNVESSLMVEFSNKCEEGQVFYAELYSYYEKLLDFTDSNLFKIDTEMILKFVEEGIVPTRQIWFDKHKKDTSSRTGNNERILQVAKKTTPKIPKSFRARYTNTEDVSFVEELEVASVNRNIIIDDYYIRDNRLFELYILLKMLLINKTEENIKINRNTFEENILSKHYVINNGNWKNTWISATGLRLIDSNNHLTKEGEKICKLSYEYFVVYLYKTYLSPYVNVLIDYFCKDKANLKASNNDIANELRSEYLSKDVEFLTGSDGRYISSWLNILRDDFGCLSFRPRSKERTLTYNPMKLDEESLINSIKQNTIANNYLIKILNK